MPELPEVETIIRQLKSKIVGKEIVKIDILDKLIDSKIKDIAPVKVIDVQRRAKYIIIALNNSKLFLVHLGMTGQFYYADKHEIEKLKPIYSKYLLVKFYLQDGSLLTHNSLRKFGSFELIDRDKLSKLDASLGPEPLSPDFTVEKLTAILDKKKKAALKVTLMDQHFLSGLGNIYAQEALYYAGINPHRKIGTLSSAEIKKLHDSILKVLNDGLKYKGASIDNYINLEGEGSFQKHLAVYQQDCCPKKHLLKREMIGGRGTSYCPVCQK